MKGWLWSLLYMDSTRFSKIEFGYFQIGGFGVIVVEGEKTHPQNHISKRLHQQLMSIADDQPVRQCSHCFTERDGQELQRMLQRVETQSSSSTASNIRGPGRTMDRILSIAGRRLEQALEPRSKRRKQAKVLIVGSPGSGKSELIEQLRLIHQVPYTRAEVESLRMQIEGRSDPVSETPSRSCERELVIVDADQCTSNRQHHDLSGLTCVLFVVSLSGYDEYLSEDCDATQLQDSLAIWSSICHSRWFQRTPLLLVLNKDEFFSEKISNSGMRDFFPDYKDAPNDALLAVRYFERRFRWMALRACPPTKRALYIHVGSSRGKSNLRFILGSLKDIFLRTVLSSAWLT